MIWVRGKVVADEALQASVMDRTFEHGLGLFETFRTWNGRPTLLDWHIERMRRSAKELDLLLNSNDLPDARSVADLTEANRGSLPAGQDVRLRLTLSGGVATTPPSASVLWMTVTRLSDSSAPSLAVISQCLQVAPDDFLARHKTLNYWRKRIALSDAARNGSDDVLIVTPDRFVCETARANVFFVQDRRLITPSLDGPLLPGVMRKVVSERARQLGLGVDESPVPLERILTVDEAFLTNSVRGILPINLLLERTLPAPGPITRQLWAATLPWLESGGITS